MGRDDDGLPLAEIRPVVVLWSPPRCCDPYASLIVVRAPMSAVGRWSSAWRGRPRSVWDLATTILKGLRDLTNAAPLHRFVDNSWQKLFSRVTTTAHDDERRRNAAPGRVEEVTVPLMADAAGKESLALVRRRRFQR